MTRNSLNIHRQNALEHGERGEDQNQDQGEEQIKLGRLSGLIGFCLRLAQDASTQAIFRRLAAEEADMGYKPGHFAVLTIIANNPGATQTAVSSAACRDKSTLTPVINDFVRRGLIHRDPIRGDRRSFALTLTSEGEAALARLSAISQAHEAELDAIIGAGNKEAFLAALRRIKQVLG
jgi:DNA-binding MarR family transcriptional regulator